MQFRYIKIYFMRMNALGIAELFIKMIENVVSPLNSVGIVLQRFFLCLGIFVVRPKHPDFITEAQRHKDEGISILRFTHILQRRTKICMPIGKEQ